MNTRNLLPAANDAAIASPARIYDCYLRGTSHCPVDTEVARKVLATVPNARKLAKANRKFVIRAAQLMARRGISQFLDLGCGMATVPSIHQAVRAIWPGAHVLYVDNDPDVSINNPALTAGEGVAFMLADLRRPVGLLARAEEYNVLDFSQPIGVLACAVLHHLTHADQPYLDLSVLKGRMAPGSYLALSHITSHGTDPDVQTAIKSAYVSAAAPAIFRKKLEISAFFEGLHLINPGLVEVAEWRGNGRITPAQPYALKFLCGVARKPPARSAR